MARGRTAQPGSEASAIVGTSPLKYRSADDCPHKAELHRQDEPQGYLAWHEWAAKMGRTHLQERCPTCGFYAVWKPKQKCLCGHAKRNHVDGQGLCLVKSCRMCLTYRQAVIA